MLLHGDCLDKLKNLDSNSVDSLVTDPPAGISFMGHNWDGDKGGRDQWIAWMTDVMLEVNRVLKPGGHGLVWAIPRTQHWTMTALENAGFEIRDVVSHVFGSGFPKSNNIGKSIDKLLGAEREDLGPNPNRIGRKQDIRGANNGPAESMGLGKKCDAEKLTRVTKPATPEAKQWDGWGSALKPSHESWIVVSKMKTDYTTLNEVNFSIGVLVCHMLSAKFVQQNLELKKVNLTEVLNFVANYVENNPGKLRDDLNGKTDIFKSPEMAKMFLSIDLLWRNFLVGLYGETNKFTTSMKLKTITELKTLKSSLSMNILENIIHPNQSQDQESHAITVEQCLSDLSQLNKKEIFVTGSVLTSTINQGVKRIVEFAVRNLDQPMPKEMITAPLNAAEPQEGKHQENERSWYVKTAISALRQLFPETLNTVGKNAWVKDLEKHESWILIRKKLDEKTIAKNVLKHGTGGINIDACRIGLGEDRSSGGLAKIKSTFQSSGKQESRPVGGRFPSNLIFSHHEKCIENGTKEVKSDSHHSYKRKEDSQHLVGIKTVLQDKGNVFASSNGKETVADWDCHPDCAVRALDEQSGVLKTGGMKSDYQCKDKGWSGQFKNEVKKEYGADTGGASRFFYCAKASKKDRGEGNVHPTVKSQKLMSYLIKLVTPPNGIVLDPFMGSGSTCLAAKNNHFKYIGIETEKEYFEIASKRLEN